MADALPSALSGDMTLYRDKKFATWAIFVPKMAGITVPIWNAITDCYGRKVTIMARSQADLIKNVEEYSQKNERKISPTETETLTSYSIYGLVGGAVLAGIGMLTKSPKLGYAGGIVSVASVAGVVTGAVLKPTLGEDQVVALPVLAAPPGATIPNVPGITDAIPGLIPTT